jgi:hypothetical protein
MTYPSPAGAAMFGNLQGSTSEDCQFCIFKHQIIVWAPSHEIDRLMAIVKAHDVAPENARTTEVPAE